MFLSFPSTLEDDAGWEWSGFRIKASDAAFVSIELDMVEVDDIRGDFIWNAYVWE